MRAIRSLSLFLLLAVTLAASTVLRVNFARLSQSADRVVAGRVTSITADKDPATGYIFSNVTLSVSEAVPSTLVGREYSFRMIGGELDGKRLYIADFPRFQVDEKVVLFLNSQTGGVFGPTIGLWQGVFFVDKDPSTGAETVMDHKRRPIIGVRDQQLLRGAAREKVSSTALTIGGGTPSGSPANALRRTNFSIRFGSTEPRRCLTFLRGAKSVIGR